MAPSPQPVYRSVDTDAASELPSESSGAIEDDAVLISQSSVLLSPTAGSQARDLLDSLIQPEELWIGRDKRIRAFYSDQNAFVSTLKTITASSEDTVDDEEEEEPSTAAYVAIQLSVGLTFVILAMKLFVALYSGSIAMLASSIDSILDLASQGTLLWMSRLIRRYDPYQYPAGKSRMEPMSILIFSIIMGLAALELLSASINELIDGIEAGGTAVRMDTATITVLVVVIVTQFCMYLYCRRVAAMDIPGAASADALAQDHINDVCINLLGGVPAIIAGQVSSLWALDATGGILISIYIGLRWLNTGWKQLPTLLDKSADPAFLGQLTYLAATHSEHIAFVDTVLAYQVGNKLQCEIHIVLNRDMPLHQAHDIAESLEQKIESLREVETCFVHADYEWQHKPEHKQRIRAARMAANATKKKAQMKVGVHPDYQFTPSQLNHHHQHLDDEMFEREEVEEMHDDTSEARLEEESTFLQETEADSLSSSVQLSVVNSS